MTLVLYHFTSQLEKTLIDSTAFKCKLCYFWTFQQTLFNILDDLSRYGNIVWKLNQFVDVVALETSCGTSSSSSQHRLNDNSTSGDAGGICQTYQAFGIAVSHVLQQFKWELVAMETEICAQGIYEIF